MALVDPMPVAPVRPAYHRSFQLMQYPAVLVWHHSCQQQPTCDLEGWQTRDRRTLETRRPTLRARGSCGSYAGGSCETCKSTQLSAGMRCPTRLVWHHACQEQPTCGLEGWQTQNRRTGHIGNQPVRPVAPVDPLPVAPVDPMPVAPVRPADTKVAVSCAAMSCTFGIWRLRPEPLSGGNRGRVQSGMASIPSRAHLLSLWVQWSLQES